MELSAKSLQILQTIIHRDCTTVELNFQQNICVLEAGNKLGSIKLKTKIPNPVSTPFEIKLPIDLLINFYKSVGDLQNHLVYELKPEKDKEDDYEYLNPTNRLKKLKISFKKLDANLTGEYQFVDISHKTKQIYKLKPLKTWHYFEANQAIFEALKVAKRYCCKTSDKTKPPILYSVNVEIANNTVKVRATNTIVAYVYQLKLSPCNFEGSFQLSTDTIQLFDKASIKSAIFLIDSDLNAIAIQSLNTNAIITSDCTWIRRLGQSYPKIEKELKVADTTPGFQVRSSLLKNILETIKTEAVYLIYERPKLIVSNKSDETVLVNIPPVNDTKNLSFRVDRKMLLSLLKGGDRDLIIQLSEHKIKISCPSELGVFYLALMVESNK